MKHFEGKHVVITGGTTGIGLETARQFQRAGASVMICGRSEQAVNAALDDLDSGASGVVCDVSRLADLDHLVGEAKSRFDSVDILFANAGLAHFRPLAEMTEALYDDIMDVNVKGLFFTVQKMVTLMGEGGVIVLTGSIAPRKGQPGTSIYGASKGAVRALTRGLAVELLEKGIRVNCISPGPVATPLFSKMVNGDEAETQAIIDRLSSTVPLGRIGTAEEIAEAVLFMAGSGAAYMIGSELVLDGGKTEL